MRISSFDFCNYVICRDNVVWDEDQEREAQEKVNKNSKNKVTVELQGSITSSIWSLGLNID